ncbi:hypothetical protein AVEN_45729-1 [Araneus ventricosus]|uniref:Transposon Ty3-I Gag-Pol polyprotein n=1 Tax=Araneus ventricosus TaxID=182803 RepID=A0A4Y2X068_ARAVE|nr:hypothetical protein AVEN_45729-1 [Araneus ventricosus]
MKLKLRDGAKPSYTPEWNVPYALKEKVDKELDYLEAAGIISKSITSDWGSPLVVIPKGDGTVRLCIDYKAGVNDLLMNINYSIKKIDEVLYSLRDSKYFCKLDLFKTYLLLQTDEESNINPPSGADVFFRFSCSIQKQIARIYMHIFLNIHRYSILKISKLYIITKKIDSFNLKAKFSNLTAKSSK